MVERWKRLPGVLDLMLDRTLIVSTKHECAEDSLLLSSGFAVGSGGLTGLPAGRVGYVTDGKVVFELVRFDL